MKFLSALLLFALSPLPALSGSVEIRVLIVGSEKAVSSGGAGKVKAMGEQQLAFMNQTFLAQRVPATLVMTGFETLAFGEAGEEPHTELCRGIFSHLYENDPWDTVTKLQELRGKHKADLVVTLIHSPLTNADLSAGAACVREAAAVDDPSKLDNSYAFIDIVGLPSFVLQHEVGHLFGLDHDFAVLKDLAAGTMMMPKTPKLKRIPVWSDREFRYKGRSLDPGKAPADVEVLRKNITAVSQFFESWNRGLPVTVEKSAQP